jgi:hypothetical protein
MPQRTCPNSQWAEGSRFRYILYGRISPKTGRSRLGESRGSVSDTPQGAGWWMAADNRWYAPETHPNYVPPPPPPPGPPPGTPPPPAQTNTPPPNVPGPGPGWWQASDGMWYPPQPGATPPPTYGYGYGSPPFERKTNGLAIWALVLVIVLGGIGALAGIPMGFVARSQVRKSNGTQKGAGLALAAIIVGFVMVALIVVLLVIGATVSNTNSSNAAIANGPSLSDLTANVKAHIVGTGTGNFDVTGVASVVCNPPDSWRPGATFTCYAYDNTQNEIGEYDGTVEPDSSSGNYQWNASWNPTG